MKNAKIRFVQGLLFAAVLTCLGAAGVARAQVAGNTEYCEITLAGCPPEYDQKELVVPLQVIALSTHVAACGIQDSTANMGGEPAIMFLIDHSQSMTSSKNPGELGNDVNGNRFRVTRALVDTISKIYPSAQIGVAVFAEGLVFNSTWDQNLVPFNGVTHSTGGQNQSYLPLKPLNAPAESGGYANGANPTWLDVIRGMFNVPTAQTARSTLRNGTGGAVSEISGTNISIAFEAAIEAFERNSTPKQNRYIIFLSDGDPGIYGGGNGTTACDGSTTSSNPRCAMQDNFIAGTNTPTTFTVFLTSAAVPVAGVKVTQMTENIKINEYSESNPKSDIWPMSSDYESLYNFMLENIVSQMLSRSSGHPNNIVISSTGRADSTGSIADGEFIFSRQLPVDTSEVTAVNMRLRYDVQVNSTTQSGADTSYIIKDSLFTYDFTIRRTSSPPTDWKESQKLRSNCKSAPTLDLRFGGTSLIGREIKGNMDVLQIVFDNTGGLFSYSTVKVDVLNADGSVSDLETFTLTRGNDGKWTYQFPRIVSETADRGDGKLQHAAQDSIILVFRNPDVPLDTIRVAVPYVSNDMAFYDTPGDPAGGKLLPDVVEVVAGDSFNIYAKLFKPDGGWDEAMTNSGKIKWTVTGIKAPALIEDKADGAHIIFRNETAGETYTVTATYTDGPLVITNSITIKVVPGPAKYIEAVTDEAKITSGKVKDRVADTVYLDKNKEYEFNNNADAVFYAVLRDAYGNFIDMAVGARWESTVPKSITADGRGDLSEALIGKHGTSFGDNLYVIVEKDGIADTVHVTVVGLPSAAVGPNPFMPGRDVIWDNFAKITSNPNDLIRLEELYGPIIANSKSGGGSGHPENVTGVLVAATAPRPVSQKGGNGNVKYADAKAVIYDAVGHIVFESKPGDIILAETDKPEESSSTFGFVWSGKNKAGRTVGPGTYLMRMTAIMTNREKFSSQRMIGVTYRGEVR